MGMSTNGAHPPLEPLHPDSALSRAKLLQMERLSTHVLKQTLLPGGRDSLKARPDGTMLDFIIGSRYCVIAVSMSTRCLARLSSRTAIRNLAVMEGS